MSGTEWTAPGQGSTFGRLFDTFAAAKTSEAQSLLLFSLLQDSQRIGFPARDNRVNLRLTGSPITEEDWARLESDAFKVGV